jgi:hypothetical protein
MRVVTTPRPTNTLFDWLETESYELLGLVLLIAIGLFAGRVTETAPGNSSCFSSAGRRRTRCSG